MGKFQSTKLYDGFSTCFRQWLAVESHCSRLHGYSVSFKIIFEGELDERSWIFDFGGMKRAKSKIDGFTASNWMSHMFDHTTIIAEDDPEIEWFKEGYRLGVLQLRVLPKVGAERFAEFVFNKIDAFVKEETDNRVHVVSVECFEHNKNSAIYDRN
jgi:6-pyruvoyltetrahydropterin/6-carboxytetrahydropterin synthase